jgi:hypothetical protein
MNFRVLYQYKNNDECNYCLKNNFDFQQYISTSRVHLHKQVALLLVLVKVLQTIYDKYPLIYLHIIVFSA